MNEQRSKRSRKPLATNLLALSRKEMQKILEQDKPSSSHTNEIPNQPDTGSISQKSEPILQNMAVHLFKLTIGSAAILIVACYDC